MIKLDAQSDLDVFAAGKFGEFAREHAWILFFGGSGYGPVSRMYLQRFDGYEIVIGAEFCEVKKLG